MEQITKEIEAFRENDSMTHSPSWIWFSKIEKNLSICLLCNTKIKSTNSNTTSMGNHIKRLHNSKTDYDASLIFEELSELRDMRISSKRQIQRDNGNFNHFNSNRAKKQIAKLQKMTSHPSWNNNPMKRIFDQVFQDTEEEEVEEEEVEEEEVKQDAKKRRNGCNQEG